jgi:hypothetical protein
MDETGGRLRELSTFQGFERRQTNFARCGFPPVDVATNILLTQAAVIDFRI